MTDMVKFRMPDGTMVSNDPRFDLDAAMAKSLENTAQRGSEGPTWDEQQAQILSAGRPEQSTGDPTRDLHGPVGSPAQITQKEDAEAAAAAGASPSNTSVDDADPVDSNEEVAKVRESLAADQEAQARAEAKLGDDGPGDPDVAYEDWTGKQLLAEVARRNAQEDRDEEDRIEAKKGMKKADVADLLYADDALEEGDASSDAQPSADV